MFPRRPLLRRTASLLTAALFAAIASVASAQPTYPLDFTPPWKPGQKFTLKSNASEANNMVITQGEAVLKKQESRRTAEMEADAEALAGFPHGGLSKAAFTVRSFRVSVNGAPAADFLPAGAKIVAESTGPDKKTYTIDGVPATEQQIPVLKLVTSLDDPDHNDQIMFGPKKAVAVGESWQPDVKAMQATLGKDFGVSTTITGAMKLDAVEGSGDKQVSTVSGSVTFADFVPPMPPGVTAKSGVLRMNIDGRIPASRSASTRVENLTSNAIMVGEAVNPAGVTLTLTLKVDTKSTTVTTFP